VAQTEQDRNGDHTQCGRQNGSNVQVIHLRPFWMTERQPSGPRPLPVEIPPIHNRLAREAKPRTWR
jgi:hypothetical protein